MPSPSERALSIATAARTAERVQLAALRAAEPEFSRVIDRWAENGKITLIYTATQKFGKTCEERVKAQGGVGVSVHPSLEIKRARRA